MGRVPSDRPRRRACPPEKQVIGSAVWHDTVTRSDMKKTLGLLSARADQIMLEPGGLFGILYPWCSNKKPCAGHTNKDLSEGRRTYLPNGRACSRWIDRNGCVCMRVVCRATNSASRACAAVRTLRTLRDHGYACRGAFASSRGVPCARFLDLLRRSSSFV